MAGILYYKSGCTLGVNLKSIPALGLEYAFTSSPHSREFNSNSPSGSPGVMFADHQRLGEGRLPEYEPARQTWIKMPRRAGRPELWAGYWIADRPTPADLERGSMLDSLRVELLDGAEWLVPVVCEWDEVRNEYRSRLRSYLAFDDDGQPCQGPPIEAYAHLWGLVAPLASLKLARVMKQTEDEPTEAALTMAAVELLKANYVIDLPEIVLLQLLDGVTINTVVDASSRYHALLKWIRDLADEQKKSASTLSISGSTGGSAA